jgi:hypothetical protein
MTNPTANPNGSQTDASVEITNPEYDPGGENPISPRQLTQIEEAAHKFQELVWYNRKFAVDETKHPRYIIEAMRKAMREVEAKYPGETGPWNDIKWGMILGKLSALRWVLGDEWDSLDT